MFDINTAINAAIIAAVQEHTSTLAARIFALEDANKGYLGRIAELAEEIDETDSTLSEARKRIADLEEANTVLVERLNNMQPQAEVTDPATGLDYFQKSNLCETFVERLNDAEWFWNKVNTYVDTHIERRESESVTVDNFPELFAVEFNRKAGADNVLSRDEVADIVRELWTEEFDSEIDDKVERAIDDIDLSDEVRREVRDLSFSITVY